MFRRRRSSQKDDDNFLLNKFRSKSAFPKENIILFKTEPSVLLNDTTINNMVFFFSYFIKKLK